MDIGSNGTKLSAFEKELKKAIQQINEYKLAAEANIVAILFKKPELLYEANLKLENFSNNIWKVYFAIVQGVILIEGKSILDDVTVGLYLEKHPKLKEKYDEYGGYTTIANASEYVVAENFDGYVKELNKWNVVLELAKRKFPIQDRLSDYADMTAEEIYNEWEVILNHTFVNVDTDIKSYNACDDIQTLIDKLNQGASIGLPLHNCTQLNKEIAGLNLGHIYALGALSGVGKSTTAINWIIPSILNYNEQVVFIINEEDETKLRKELIVWVANNIYKEQLNKYVLRDGNFTKETLEILEKCAKWIEEKKDNRNITIIPLSEYTVGLAIKIIKKYAAMGVKYFVLDTFKESADAEGEPWLSMTRDMVKLYDVIKQSAKNVCLFITYQLGMAATKKRYYTNEEIGLARGIVNVMSVNLMMRKVLDDEKEGGRRELTTYKLEGKHKLSKIPFKLNKDKHYVLIFITKNRFGNCDPFQIVAEYDLSLNTYREVGICHVPLDW